MDLFLNRIFDGLSNGSTYALIALALVMIFKATTLINFAQGEMAMFGAFIVLVLATEQGVPMWIAVFLGMIISGIAADVVITCTAIQHIITNESGYRIIKRVADYVV